MSQSLQSQTCLSLRSVCSRLALPYSSLRRWQDRQRRGLPLLQAPGPKKHQSVPWLALQQKIDCLDHGTHRTHHTGGLYDQFADSISRRELGELVSQAREQHNQARGQAILKVDWLKTNLAWAIDATEIQTATGKLSLIASREMASRFFLEPVVAVRPDAELVAQHLEQLFQKHSPPLLLKRDNGSIFNAAPVNAVLARFGVIPLNSPTYYPPYNGSIENGIGELKAAWRKLGLPQVACGLEFVSCTARALAHQRNCVPRRSLNGASACEKFYRDPIRFSVRERDQILQSLYGRWSAIMNHVDNVTRCCARAWWRDVVVSWLRCQHLIEIAPTPNVLPHSNLSCAQN